MTSKIKKNNKGFTIVELLIVIVIIGILAALVLNSFRGVQERARDTERQTDINAQAGQLEVYYTDNSGYPVIADVSTDSWITSNFKGADLNAWRTPKAANNSMTDTANPTKAQYGYQTFNDDGTACTGPTGTLCAKFKLYWYSEDKKQVMPAKESLN